MATKRRCIQLLLAVPLLASVLVAQETHTVRVPAPFTWPNSARGAIRANDLPNTKVESFLRAIIDAYVPPASRIGGTYPRTNHFRFAPLERGRFYLVALSGGRVESFVDVVAPVASGYRFTRIESESPLPLGMSFADPKGTGAADLITARWPAGYLGASTPPIFWYTVWRFHDGVPRDVSRDFPDLYERFLLPQVSYIAELLGKLQSTEPEAARVPLAEVEYIRLKYQRVILGKKDAGLEAAISWAKSGKVSLEVLGMSSLAEIPAQAAQEELLKLSRSPKTRDLARGFLAERARLLHQPPQKN